ncbi:hypothetical protein BV22DRAFT_1133620 [Leucogyrophana mollusca]|uniref:Uncharacterized protein n=1 Tax=Leucogyrophana mollusca TaxID=85980 RepID=A0ACB8B1R0_9AGAM|nr:hypothetical protein BV22DRAFT_1133620 [Leucogyrophana mollusca]
MARTKNTARKVTGGSATRKVRQTDVASSAPMESLRRSVKRPRPRSSTPLPTAVSVVAGKPAATSEVRELRWQRDQDGNKWCYMCQDGGHLLFRCDNCPRVVCSRCIEVPEAITSTRGGQDSMFECPTCHIARVRREEVAGPYTAFYTPNENGQYGQPLLTSMPITIPGAFSLGSGAKVDSRSLCIVHFVCKGQNVNGGPARMAKTYLEGYIGDDSLVYVEVEFDLTLDEGERDFVEYKMKLANYLVDEKYARLMIFVTTHSDDTSGDLFVGPKCCFEVGMWMDTFFGGPMAPVVQGATVFLLACGTVVTLPDPFIAVQKKVTEYRFSSLWAFGAPGLHPNAVVPFVVAFCQRVVVEGAQPLKIIAKLLAASSRLNLHSDVLHISPATSSLHHAEVHRYVWSHKTIRPWGSSLPVQCPKCKCLKSWSSPTRQDNAYIFTCASGVGECQRKPSRQRFESRGVYRFVEVGASSDGKWIEYTS